MTQRLHCTTEIRAKENSGAANDAGEEHLTNAKNLASLGEGTSGSSENDVAAVSPESPAKPATIVPGETQRGRVSSPGNRSWNIRCQRPLKVE
ncbi:hypothetical protein MTO96_007096 [Rhipicephalus appendiculatus]